MEFTKFLFAKYTKCQQFSKNFTGKINPLYGNMQQTHNSVADKERGDGEGVTIHTPVIGLVPAEVCVLDTEHSSRYTCTCTCNFWTLQVLMG